MMTSNEERKPLLNGGENTTPSAPPVSSTIDNPPPYMEEPTVPQLYSGPPPVNYSQSDSQFPAPPPYSPSSGQTLFVQCRVCQHVIHVPQGSQSRVVKCGSCQEATPISAPPPGKKYVRCPCNCLLTCSATATRVICPRPNCKRTIGVGSITVRQNANLDRVRVTCGHCRRSILWPAHTAVARCPHCRGRSYINYSWMKYRAMFCVLLGLLFIFAGCIVTGVTLGVAISQGGIYVISVGFFVSGIGLLIRSFFYCIMTRSLQEV